MCFENVLMLGKDVSVTSRRKQWWDIILLDHVTGLLHKWHQWPGDCRKRGAGGLKCCYLSPQLWGRPSLQQTIRPQHALSAGGCDRGTASTLPKTQNKYKYFNSIKYTWDPVKRFSQVALDSLSCSTAESWDSSWQSERKTGVWVTLKENIKTHVSHQIEEKHITKKDLLPLIWWRTEGYRAREKDLNKWLKHGIGICA